MKILVELLRDSPMFVVTSKEDDVVYVDFGVVKLAIPTETFLNYVNVLDRTASWLERPSDPTVEGVPNIFREAFREDG